MRTSKQQADRSDESPNGQLVDGVAVDATLSRLGAEGTGAEGIALQADADADAGKQAEAAEGRVQYHAAGYDPAWLLLFAVQVSAYVSYMIAKKARQDGGIHSSVSSDIFCGSEKGSSRWSNTLSVSSDIF